jgi:hypothetical protein
MQPKGGCRYIDTISYLAKSGPIASINVAVAYATIGGADLLMYSLRESLGEGWTSAKKRFVVGIDYCRTDPEAILLLGQGNTRIHDGAEVVRRKLCTPRVSFHPKVFAFSAPGRWIVVSGSGNLSKCGLTTGHEVCCYIRVENPQGAHEKSAWTTCDAVAMWFANVWKNATPSAKLIDSYSKVYNSAEHLKHPCPTDDDVASTDKLKTMSMVLPLKSCDNFGPVVIFGSRLAN